MSWTFRRYDPSMSAVWDKFVSDSRNATFIHFRGYMDYHSDRFEDFSLMAYKNDRLLALLPANINDLDGQKKLSSHGGLTYGGWLLPVSHLDAPDYMELWNGWLDWCRNEGIDCIDYRPVPIIYHRAPSGEDIYALWRSGAVMSECNLSASVDLEHNPGINQMRRRHLNRLNAKDYVIERTDDVGQFHELLSSCLDVRHGAVPVHNVSELKLLAERFPENIELWVLKAEGEIMAGICVFVTDTTFHCQYIATSPAGRTGNFLTPLIISLLGRAEECGKRYFDFGTSNEDHGLYLNLGLIRQKYSYGASGVPYQRFLIDLNSGNQSSAAESNINGGFRDVLFSVPES